MGPILSGELIMMKRLLATSLILIICLSALLQIPVPSFASDSGGVKTQVHDIIILNETDLQKYIEEGIVTGKGTEQNPYTIKDLTIKYTPFVAPVPIILIKNFTSSYFLIENVKITPIKWNLSAAAGISLDHVNNVVIKDVYINETVGGIILENCHNIQIYSTKIVASPLVSAMMRSGSRGIQIFNCTGVKIENVQMDTDYGILLQGPSPENYKLQISGVELKGFPVLYYWGGKVYLHLPGVTLPQGPTKERMAGEIIVANASSVVMDNVFSVGDIVIAYCKEVFLWNLHVRGSYYGVYVDHVQDFRIYASLFKDINYGMAIHDAKRITICDNFLQSGFIVGIAGDGIQGGKIEFNFIHNCTMDGIALEDSHNITIEYNIIVHIGGNGILLGKGTSNITVTRNDIWNVAMLPGKAGFGEDNGKDNVWYNNSYMQTVYGAGGIPMGYRPAGKVKILGSAHSVDEHPYNGTIFIPQVLVGEDNFPSSGKALISVGILSPVLNATSNLKNRVIYVNSIKYFLGNSAAITTWVSGSKIVVKYGNITLEIPTPPRVSYVLKDVIIIVGAAGAIGLIALLASERRKGKKGKKKRSRRLLNT